MAIRMQLHNMAEWNGHEVSDVGNWYLERLKDDRVVWDYRGSGQIIVAIGRDPQDKDKWIVKTGQPPLIGAKTISQGVEMDTAIKNAEDYMKENTRPSVLGQSECPFSRD